MFNARYGFNCGKEKAEDKSLPRFDSIKKNIYLIIIVYGRQWFILKHSRRPRVFSWQVKISCEKNQLSIMEAKHAVGLVLT